MSQKQYSRKATTRTETALNKSKNPPSWLPETLTMKSSTKNAQRRNKHQKDEITCFMLPLLFTHAHALEYPSYRAPLKD